jgi:hypothetical protein
LSIVSLRSLRTVFLAAAFGYHRPVFRLIAAALFTVTFARTAVASPVQLEIVGDACTLDTLEAEVTQLVSPRLSTSSPTRLRVEALRDSTGFVANIWFPDRVDGQRGPRVVSAATCAQLVESVALVIAIALPEAAAEAERPNLATEEPPASAEPSATSIETALVQTVALPAARETAFDLYVAGGSGFSAKGLRGQLLIGTRARRGAGSLGVQLRADAPEERPVTELGRVRVLRSELSVSPCLHLGSIAGCGVASVGAFHGSGIGLHAARSAFAPLISTGLRVTWEHDLAGPVAVRAYIETEAVLTSTQFEVDYMPVWTSGRFEGSGGLGVIARFL